MSLSPHRGWGAYSRVALNKFFVPEAALIRGRRLFEGGAYLSKYGNYKGSTFSLVILRLGFELLNSRTADWRSTNWANQAAFIVSYIKDGDKKK